MIDWSKWEKHLSLFILVACFIMREFVWLFITGCWILVQGRRDPCINFGIRAVSSSKIKSDQGCYKSEKTGKRPLAVCREDSCMESEEWRRYTEMVGELFERTRECLHKRNGG